MIDRDHRINLASSAQTGANRPSGRARLLIAIDLIMRP